MPLLRPGMPQGVVSSSPHLGGRRAPFYRGAHGKSRLGRRAAQPSTRARQRTRARRLAEPGIPRALAVGASLWRNGRGDQFGDVFDLHLAGEPFGLDAVFEHGDAEWAAGRDGARSGFMRLVQAHATDALALRLLHERASASPAAAEALAPAALHLDHL